MLTKIVMAFVLALAPAAFADTGSASLRIFSGASAGYDLKMNGDQITGDIYNLGGTNGKVDLKKVNGKWQGRLGIYRIDSGAVIQKAANKTQVKMKVFPGGNYTFTTKLKNNNLSMNAILSNGLLVNASLSDNGDNLDVSNQLMSMSLDGRSEGLYRGTIMVRSQYGNWAYFDTDLKTTGAMAPKMVAKEDHALFILLYVVPLNLYK
jgi:hypothetical protein